MGKSLASGEGGGGLGEQSAGGALLGQSACRRVQETFSRAGQQQAFHALYAELLARPGPESAEFSTKGVAVQQTPEGSLEESSLPFISIVIPVRNEEKHLLAVLDGLLGRDYPADRYETLVVDANSTDVNARVVQ